MPFRERLNEPGPFSLNRETPVSRRGSSVPQFEAKCQVISELHGRCQISDIFWLKNRRKLPLLLPKAEGSRWLERTAHGLPGNWLWNQRRCAWISGLKI